VATLGTSTGEFSLLMAVFVCTLGKQITKKARSKIMATVIRLARYGAKKRPYYHVVVTDSRNARNSGSILETVGKYNPMLGREDDKRVILDIEKIKSWMAKGAKPSDRVYKFLVKAGVVAAKPIPNQTKKNQPSEKTQMKIKDKAEKLAKIAEEKAAAEAAAKAAAEAPAEPAAEEVAPVAEEAPATETAPEATAE
jgi:small subunit ribosomal protein S16